MICPNARVRAYDAEVHGRGLPAFWEFLARYSPCVEPLAGRGHEVFLAWPDAALPTRDVEAIRKAYPEGSIGIASNRLVARLACPDSPGVAVVMAGQEGAFLASRPVDDLWVLPAPTQERLKRLGFWTAGQVAAVPAEVLMDQMGAEALRARRAAMGFDPTSVRCLFPPRAVEVARSWEPCLDSSAAVAAASALAREAGARLARGEGARRLMVGCDGESGRCERAVRHWRLACADAAAIGRAAGALAAEVVRRLGEPVARIGVRLEELAGLPAVQGSLLPAGQPVFHASGQCRGRPHQGAGGGIRPFIPDELIQNGIRLGVSTDRYEVMLRWCDPLLAAGRPAAPVPADSPKRAASRKGGELP